MRILFLIALVVSIILGFLNGFLIPSRQDSAKEIMDAYVRDLPVGNLNERRYKDIINLAPPECRIENLEIDAENGKWEGIAYRNLKMKVEKIRFDPYALLVKKRKKVISVGNVEFSAETTLSELAAKLTRNNQDLKQITMWYDGGHVFIRGYFDPLKSELEFDGAFIVSPGGDLKYFVNTVKNVDDETVHSRQVMSLIEEKTDFVLIVKILDRTIKLDKLEVNETGIRFAGRTE